MIDVESCCSSVSNALKILSDGLSSTYANTLLSLQSSFIGTELSTRVQILTCFYHEIFNMVDYYFTILVSLKCDAECCCALAKGIASLAVNTFIVASAEISSSVFVLEGTPNNLYQQLNLLICDLEKAIIQLFKSGGCYNKKNFKSWSMGSAFSTNQYCNQPAPQPCGTPCAPCDPQPVVPLPFGVGLTTNSNFYDLNKSWANEVNAMWADDGKSKDKKSAKKASKEAADVKYVQEKDTSDEEEEEESSGGEEIGVAK